MLLVLALAPLALKAEEPVETLPTPWVTTVSVESDPEIIDTGTAKQPGDFAELRSRLDDSDRALALSALQVAMTEHGDGVPLVWERQSRGLTGTIRPLSAFRDDSGRVCRHLIYSLALGTDVKEAEGTACREPDGKWSLQG